MTLNYKRPNVLFVPRQAYYDVIAERLSPATFIELIRDYNNLQPTTASAPPPQPEPDPVADEDKARLKKMVITAFPSAHLDNRVLTILLQESGADFELLQLAVDSAVSYAESVSNISSVGGFLINSIRNYDADGMRATIERNKSGTFGSPLERALLKAERHLQEEERSA